MHGPRNRNAKFQCVLEAHAALELLAKLKAVYALEATLCEVLVLLGGHLN